MSAELPQRSAEPEYIWQDPLWLRAHRMCLTTHRLTRRLPQDEAVRLGHEMRCVSQEMVIAIATATFRPQWSYDQLIVAEQSAAELSYLLVLARELRFLHHDGLTLLLAEMERLQRALNQRRKNVLARVA